MSKSRRHRAEMLITLSQYAMFTDSQTYDDAVALAKSGENCRHLPPDLAVYYPQMRDWFRRELEKAEQA